jgi:ribosome-binding protein aMBF1 (putative translation factor)
MSTSTKTDDRPAEQRGMMIGTHHYGPLIRSRREANIWSSAILAERAGLTETFVTGIESGLIHPWSRPGGERIIEILGLTRQMLEFEDKLVRKVTLRTGRRSSR